MFKKFLHISISVLLVITTTGVTISKHYSGGKLYSFSITGEAHSCCEDDCNCCQNSVDTYRLTAAYMISTNPYLGDEPIIDLRDLFNVVEQDIYDAYQYHSTSIVQYKLPASVPDIQAQLQSFLL